MLTNHQSLPSDIFNHILSILQAKSQLKTLANIAQCSIHQSTAIIPYLYDTFTLNSTSFKGIFPHIRGYLPILVCGSIEKPNDPEAFQMDVSNPQDRIFRICKSIRKMIIEPFEPKGYPAECFELRLITKFIFLARQDRFPELLFPRLKVLQIKGPTLNASPFLDEIFDLLKNACEPRSICFSMAESGCGYAVFKDFQESKLIRKDLEEITIHQMHNSHLPEPSKNIKLKVSFRDHLCPPGSVRDTDGAWEGRRCKWNCDKRFAKAILQHIQAYPQDDDGWPPLLVVASRMLEKEGTRHNESSDRAVDEEDKLIDGNDDEDEDENDATSTSNQDNHNPSQSELISTQLNHLIEKNATRYEHNSNGDERVRLENIENWKRRVVFIADEQVCEACNGLM